MVGIMQRVSIILFKASLQGMAVQSQWDTGPEATFNVKHGETAAR
jgi:hypothetical protein